MGSLKMSWFDKILFIAALAALSGCYDHTNCGDEEVCNYSDDNCDGQIDEDFRNDDGLYTSLSHCGACGVDCPSIHQHAIETDCVPAGDSYGCIALTCEPGYHLFNDACLPDVEIACLPCEDDEDCSLFSPGARCVRLDMSMRCVRPCEGGCPEGFDCLEGECRPVTGSCACTPETEGVTYPCLLETDDSVCAGRFVCEGGEMTSCEPAFEEHCNGEDDDCDGLSDEDFLDTSGRYVHVDHCGECNSPCAAPGPHYEARCEIVGGRATCLWECEEGFSDVDGVQANGCECEFSVGTWPPSRLGVDADCDGELDDTDEFIFVASWGADGDPGTLIRPKRTIAAGMATAAAVSKTVVATGGIYHERVTLVAGVEVYGGYSADFSDRDPVLYTTVIEPHDGRHGHPALICDGITTRTVVGGLTIRGSDAAAVGAGSTAVFLNRCSSAVELVDLTIMAGRGSDGRAGNDSSDNLDEWGLSTLMELNGQDARDGADGFETSSPACRSDSVPGGVGGTHSCAGSRNNVSGGAGGDAACVDAGCRVGAPCGNSGCTDFMVGDFCDMDAMLAAAVPNPPGEDGSGPGAGRGGPPTYQAPTNRGSCHFCDDNPTLARVGENGADGENGRDGSGGEGCSETTGRFDTATGIWTSGSGTDGDPGSDGGGGGGGSSGGGYDVVEGIDGCNDALGGSGGGGGSGGCGAPWASGGGGAGSSIGIAILLPRAASAGPSCRGVTVVASRGGSGGPGGIGAAGGSNGVGGRGGGTEFWCSRRGGRGGDGGEGGDGGGGGGGCGGSVSGFHVIATDAAAVDYLEMLAAENSVEALPTGGRGGPAGFSPGHSGSSGADGTAVSFRLVE